MKSAYAKLPAQDIERARRFYDEKLGLQPVHEHHDHLRYDVGGQQFLLFPSSGAPSGAHDQLGFVVDDIEAEVERLEAKGIDFGDGIADLDGLRAAWFKDSEGNLLSM